MVPSLANMALLTHRHCITVCGEVYAIVLNILVIVSTMINCCNRSNCKGNHDTCGQYEHRYYVPPIYMWGNIISMI